MYKLEFTLKQHTPIIHFQHDQDGATLRATEVKPKLDRFIVQILTGLDDDEAQKIFKQNTTRKIKSGNNLIDNPNFNQDWCNMLIGGNNDNLALDYQIKFRSTNDINYYLPYPTILNSRNYPNKERNFKIFLAGYINFDFEYLLPCSFFGNSDKIKFNDRSDIVDRIGSKPNEIKFAISTESEINAIIYTGNKMLLSNLQENLLSFFLLNNFGTRQDKGFGSFEVNKINNVKQTYSDLTLSKFFIKKSISTFSDYNEIFDFILKEYNQLKSGTNKPYNKSELFKYFVNNNIRWEKRFIKRKLNANGVRLKMQTNTDFEPLDMEDSTTKYYNDFSDLQTNDYKYVRALFGLAENFEFATYNRGRLKIKVKHTGVSKIERFQSPVFFKIINNQVYLSFNDSYKSIEGETFDFYDGSTSLGKLQVPIGFNLKIFIIKHLSKNWSNI